ncbi:MAG TPA: carboxylating nicotinate-nucleotide diphosphorylase [Chitinophagaceae bacterium]|nr:carboxylating nicotinate-nucleotide diphosphorylase [Chitinophagaceae bacterium]
MMTDEQLRHLVDEALREDLGDGDHSTLCCIPAATPGKAVLKIKQDGILAGLEVAARIFRYRQPSSRLRAFKRDGEAMRAGEVAFEVEADADIILQCERLVLNCMQRMSGIATLTRQYVDRLEGYHTRVLDTRKTTPNFRLLEKEAVRLGGGVNHRFGLYDMIMLKDNHIDFCGGIRDAILRAHAYVCEQRPGLRIEVETRSLADVRAVLEVGRGKVFRVLLDNFTPDQVGEAVQCIGGAFESEASGGINLDNITAYAQTGVDYVSVGALIHQARSLDLSLKAVLS